MNDFQCPECDAIFHMDDVDLPADMSPIMCPDCGYNGCKMAQTEVDALRAQNAELIEACKALVHYSERNTLNFQLEKLSDFVDAIRAAIAKAAKVEGK